jgi:putative ABC transport system permease protein
MIVYHMRHAWSMLWQDKFFTIISLLGIGLAVSFIMVILTVNEIDNASIAPEVNRYRTLYVKSVLEQHGPNSNSNYYLSPKLVENVFYNLKGVEAVTAVATNSSFVEVKRLSGEGQNVNSISTDASYWKFFELEFIEGKPFSESDFKSGIRVAVITESLSKSLYKGEKPLGRDVYIAQQPYKVVGVVKDVSPSSTFAYAKIWMPYTTDVQVMNFKDEVACGALNVMVLAKSPSDFDGIIKNIENNRKRYNQPIVKDVQITLRGPDTHAEQRYRKWASDDKSKYKEVLKMWLSIIAILMVVPAFNMASFTISRMKRRQEELGLRRSFGALRRDIVRQVVAENMVLTLVGGAIGFILSILILVCFKTSLYPDGVTYSLSTFLRPAVMGYLMLTCILINLLSAVIPAVKSANQPIIHALKDQKS